MDFEKLNKRGKFTGSELILKSLACLIVVSIAVFPTYAQDEKLQRFQAKVDTALQKYFSENEPGGSVYIEQNGKVLYKKSFGLADLKTQEKFTAKTVSNTGSISKTFVAYGILLLVKEGKLSLDDSILKYFPDFKNPSLVKNVTLRHLLTHTSGIPDVRPVEKESVFYLTAKDEENFAPLKSVDQMEFEPGSKWKYSNPAYNGLALIIEKAAKMRWQDYITKTIFKPSGMTNSKITDGDSPSQDVAHGYRKVGGKFEEYDFGEYPTFTAAGNGGIWSSIDELIKYSEAIEKRRFLDAASLDYSMTAWRPVNWSSEKPPTQGFSWFVHNGTYRLILNKVSGKVIEHTGSQGGFRSHFMLIPEKKTKIIWLTNNNQSISGPLLSLLLEEKYLD